MARLLLLPSWMVGLCLAGCLAVPPAAQVPTPHDGDFPLPPAPADEHPPVDAEAVARHVLVGINRERSLHGAVALHADPALAAISRRHSADMARRGYFSHDTPEGLRASTRADRAGYRYRALGENLYQGSRYSSVARIPLRTGGYRYDYDYFTTDELADLVVEGWMESPGHRENMLSSSFTHAGLGIAVDGRDRVYVTLMLSHPAGP